MLHSIGENFPFLFKLKRSMTHGVLLQISPPCCKDGFGRFPLDHLTLLLPLAIDWSGNFYPSRFVISDQILTRFTSGQFSYILIFRNWVWAWARKTALLASSICGCILTSGNSFVISVLMLLSILAKRFNLDDVAIDFRPCLRFSWLVSKHSWCHDRYFVLYILIFYIVFSLRIYIFSILHKSLYFLFPPYVFLIVRQTDLSGDQLLMEANRQSIPSWKGRRLSDKHYQCSLFISITFNIAIFSMVFSSSSNFIAVAAVVKALAMSHLQNRKSIANWKGRRLSDEHYKCLFFSQLILLFCLRGSFKIYKWRTSGKGGKRDKQNIRSRCLSGFMIFLPLRNINDGQLSW